MKRQGGDKHGTQSGELRRYRGNARLKTVAESTEEVLARASLRRRWGLRVEAGPTERPRRRPWSWPGKAVA